MRHYLALSISKYQLIFKAKLRKFYIYGHTKPVEKDTSVQLVEQFTSGMNEEKALHLSLLFYTMCAIFQSLLNLCSQQCRIHILSRVQISPLPFFSLKNYIATLALFIHLRVLFFQMRKSKLLNKCY